MPQEELNELVKERMNKLEALRSEGVEPYGRRFLCSSDIKSLSEGFSEGKAAKIAGRIVAKREHGKSVFANIKGATGKIQIYLKADSIGAEKFGLFARLDIGDIIGVEGSLFKTRTGEVTLNVSDFTLLSKSLRPLPEKWHGLKDIETRYRQRYVDLIVNDEARDVFLLRTKIVAAMRRMLDGAGFIEVETPMMQHLAGGAAARPFKTHHEALGVDLYLRIAPELYLKRLLVGGFEKVYEINRNFRNEGISTRHNPEFTMLEVYEAYSDCAGMMELAEKLITDIAAELFGMPEVKYKDSKLSLARPWKRRALYDALLDETKVDFAKASDMKSAAARLGVEVKPEDSDYDIMNNIFERHVQPKLIEPTFITDYPISGSPLSKERPDRPGFADRFELFVGGQELANAYTELNDPLEQRRRFERQAGGGGIDEDFIRALEYGMPPAGGLGIGIDRLVMLLANQGCIRDVILFPQLKPER